MGTMNGSNVTLSLPQPVVRKPWVRVPVMLWVEEQMFSVSVFFISGSDSKVVVRLKYEIPQELITVSILTDNEEDDTICSNLIEVELTG